MSLLTEIGAWLLGIGEGTLSFFKAAILSLAQNPQLQTIAMNAVTTAENLAISGVEKQAAAKSDILGQLAAAGLPAVASQVNLAIETAVASLTATKAATATAIAAAPTAPVPDAAPAPVVAPVVPATGA